jgi:hypothetical protein
VALALAVGLAWPALAGAARQKPLTWEELTHKRPGTPLVLVLAGGEHVVARLLEADTQAVEVLDFTGRGLSDDEERRVLRRVREARVHIAGDDVSVPATAAAKEGPAPPLRRLTRDDVSAVFERRNPSGAGKALKIVTIVAGAYFLLCLGVIAVVGVPST